MPLKDLSIRALHRLDAANSRLRHSIVEACFYNLRILAQELPGRRGNGDFARNLAEALHKVGDARALIEAHFGYEVAPALEVRGLFPQEREAATQALCEIERLSATGAPSRDDQPACLEFSRRVVANVDALLAVIERMRKAASGRRLPVRPLLDELIALHRGIAEQRKVRLTFCSEVGEELKAFADHDGLLNALGEILQNALRHAFPADGSDAEITITLSPDPDTRDALIAIRDNGCGMTSEQLALIGGAGASTSGGGDGIALVRRIIEGEHLGLVTFESEPDKGTQVLVRLPRRAEPALEPEVASMDGVAQQPSAAGPCSSPMRRAPLPQLIPLRRKLAAAAVILIMLGIGGALAVVALNRHSVVTLTVSADGSGMYRRISDAIAAARPHAVIAVAPGEYNERLTLDKPLQIIGPSDRTAIVRAVDGPVLHSTASGAVVRNLKLSLDANAESAAVFIQSGDARIENCEISSKGLSCIEIAGGAPAIRDCRIGPSSLNGIFLYNAAAGEIEGNDIRDCAGFGILVRGTARPQSGGNRFARCAKGETSGM